MKKPSFEEWTREQFILLAGERGEQLWSDAEELLRRRRLLDWGVQEGRFSGKFSGERPVRCELVVPVLDAEGWERLLLEVTKTARVSAALFADSLPWDEESVQWLFSPAGYFPKEDGEIVPGKFGVYATALLQELTRRLVADPFLAFQLRGLSKEELLDRLRLGRRAVLVATAVERVETEDTDPLKFAGDGRDWESAGAEMFALSYSLRADELPASLLKRIETIPLPFPTESIDAVLTELYAHIAKRAQAYGLSLKGR